MSVADCRVLVVVPARGGSKGIPRKNLQLVGGRSLVAHAATIANSLTWCDTAMLSTDDLEIAAEGIKYGLEVPFIRPFNFSGDQALSIDVWRHAWLTMETLHNCTYDLSILLEPTSPMRMVDDIEIATNALLESGASCCFTVSRTPAHYCPEKTLVVREDQRIDFYLPLERAQTIRQKIPPYFYRNGICYVVRRQHLIDNKLIVTPGSLPVMIDRPVVNIDEPFDLVLANWLFQQVNLPY